MPKVPVPFRDIKGLTPAADVRESSDIYVLEGRNFYFDSKGPRCWWGERLIGSGTAIEDEGGVVQSIDIGNRSYVFTTRGCYVLSEDESTWTQILDLNARFADVPLADDKKWTAAYLTKGIYFSHPVYGFYKLAVGAGTLSLIAHSQVDIPGFPYGPIAVAETNGRLIVLGQKYVSWSGPNSAEDFTPQLGGAGTQLLADRVPGAPVTVLGFQTGFTVFTTEGCLIGEFIGGDTVFRFDRLTTKQLPINAQAVAELTNGEQVICTKQGLFSIQNGQLPQQVAPLFSEYLRTRFEHESGIHVRLLYMIEEDLLFVQFRDWTNHYVQNHILSLSLDKWGSFDTRNLGVIRYKKTRNAIAYVDLAGIVRKFVKYAPNKETTTGVYVGLDSKITLGYIRPAQLVGEVDSLQEMQEILLGGFPIRPRDEEASWSYLSLGNDLPNNSNTSGIVADLNFVTQEYTVNQQSVALVDVIDTSLIVNDTLASGYGLDVAAATVETMNQLSGIGDLITAVCSNLNMAAGVTVNIEVEKLGVPSSLYFAMYDADSSNLANNAIESDMYESSVDSMIRDFTVEMWDYNTLFFDHTVNIERFGITRIGASLRKTDGANFDYALAINGNVSAVTQLAAADDQGANLNPAVKMYFVNSPDYLPDSTTQLGNLYSDQSHLYVRRIQIFDDGDSTKLTERTAVDPVIRPTIVGSSADTYINDSNITVHIPAEASVGDLLLIWVGHRQSLTVPVGWTLVDSGTWVQNWDAAVTGYGGTTTNQHISLLQKICEAGDVDSDLVLTQASADHLNAKVMAIHKSDGSTPVIDQHAVQTNPNTPKDGAVAYAYVTAPGLTANGHGQLSILGCSAMMEVRDWHQTNSTGVVYEAPSTAAEEVDWTIYNDPSFANGEVLHYWTIHTTLVQPENRLMVMSRDVARTIKAQIYGQSGPNAANGVKMQYEVNDPVFAPTPVIWPEEKYVTLQVIIK